MVWWIGTTDSDALVLLEVLSGYATRAAEVWNAERRIQGQLLGTHTRSLSATRALDVAFPKRTKRREHLDSNSRHLSRPGDMHMAVCRSVCRSVTSNTWTLRALNMGPM